MRTTSRVLVASGVAAGTLAAAALSAAAAAGPPSNGCTTDNRSDVPHGVLYLAVADLSPFGYRLPGLVDDPANGGNGDGFVCGIPLGNRLTPGGHQLYDFFDNQLIPSSA
jgi:hypothetical protein